MAFELTLPPRRKNYDRDTPKEDRPKEPCEMFFDYLGRIGVPVRSVLVGSDDGEGIPVTVFFLSLVGHKRAPAKFHINFNTDVRAQLDTLKKLPISPISND